MSDPEYKLLSAIEANGGAVFVREVKGDDVRLAQLLRQRDYLIYVGALNVAHYEITPAGRVALEDHRVVLNRRRLENIRYFITTAIAVLALIVSIAALLSRVTLQ